MTTFLHAADIHLDSPLTNLRLDRDLDAEPVRGATRRALDNLVDLALAEEVDFLLLAGDLYDGPWRDFNTGLFFIDRMERLNRAGIPVFLVSGNHDAASRITRSLRLPDNVTRFSSRNPGTEILEEAGVAIHGQSYAGRVVTENLAAGYPRPVPGLLNIGLLHTALSGREGHEPYAPCTAAELRALGYDYWALGHVHQHEIVDRDPWLVFAGNIQGRHIRESGPRGCYLVRAGGGRISEVSFQPLDVVRWQELEIDCTELSRPDALRQQVQDRLAQAGEEAGGRALVARLVLTGSSDLHDLLVGEDLFWENELRGLALVLGDIFLERVVIRTQPARSGPDVDLPAAACLADIPDALDPEEVGELFEANPLATLGRALPGRIRRSALLPEDDAGRRRLLSEARDLALAALRGEEAS